MNFDFSVLGTFNPTVFFFGLFLVTLLGVIFTASRHSMWHVGGGITMLIGLAIGSVAAYFSIFGLMALFSAAKTPIVIMASVLEAGKFVLAAVLHYFSGKMKTRLRVIMWAQMFVLMLITSVGIFGFLSQAHLKHGESTEVLDAKVTKLKSQIAAKDSRITTVTDQINLIEKGTLSILEKGVINGELRAAEKARDKVKKSTKDLEKERADLTREKEDYGDELVRVQNEINVINREIGPLKYVASLIWGEDNPSGTDKAVRMMTLLIMFVFDPFAIIMFICGTMMIQTGMAAVKARKARKGRSKDLIAKVQRHRPSKKKKGQNAVEFTSASVEQPQTEDIGVAETVDGVKWDRSKLKVMKSTKKDRKKA